MFATLALLLALSASAAADAEKFPTGVVIESVPTKADPKQSYALYLPSGYTPEKKWPILYAFDPGGRGDVPVKLFKDAAEAFGYIVVGSNNSRNGLQVGAIVQAFGDDTHARLSIDQRRIFTTGFSGGSRVALATALAYQPGIAGVIACSAGFAGNPSPVAPLPFVVFATAGTNDFNFPEMQQLKRKLDGMGATNRLEVFEGDHEWPPPSVAMRAIAWLELQAMKSARRDKDDAFIDRALRIGTEKAQALETAGELYEASLEYSALAADFKGMREVKDLEANAARLAATKEAKAAIKNERNEEERQRETEVKLQTLLSQLQTSPPNADAFAELRSIVSDLNSKSDDAKNSSQRRVARRVLQAVFAQAYEGANNAYLRKDYSNAAAQLEIAVLFRPKSGRLFYDLAVAYIRSGNKGKAISSLARAVENGFADVARIEQNEAFDAIRNDSSFKKVLSAIKKS